MNIIQRGSGTGKIAGNRGGKGSGFAGESSRAPCLAAIVQIEFRKGGKPEIRLDSGPAPIGIVPGEKHSLVRSQLGPIGEIAIKGGFEEDRKVAARPCGRFGDAQQFTSDEHAESFAAQAASEGGGGGK